MIPTILPPSFRFRLGRMALLRAFLFFLALAPAGLRAQVSWSPVSSGTMANLWGVCYGGGQFVAVGEQGTILTSPDGKTWTARTSGTSAWLTAVTYAMGHYVAVGDAGAVLTSLDGVAWHDVHASFPNAVSNRLNVVQWDGAEFLLFGESGSSERFSLPEYLDLYSPGPNGNAPGWWRSVAQAFDRVAVGGQGGIAAIPSGTSAVSDQDYVETTTSNITGLVFHHGVLYAVGGAGAILTSPDAKTWTPMVSGVTVDFQGLGIFNNTLVAVGGGGTLVSLDSHGNWTPRSTGTTSLLVAVAGNDTTAIVVGFGGTILQSAAAPAVPVIATQPASVSEMAGGAASFVAQSNGSLPLSYQWYHDGTLLAGETYSSLIRVPLAASDAGNYTVTVANAAGSVSSAPAIISVLPVSSPVVDPTFHAGASLSGTPGALLPLPDGSLIAAFYQPAQIVKLKADGSLDSAWTIGNLAKISAPTTGPYVRDLLLQPDGKILVAGYFDSYNGSAQLSLVRLNSDGSLDPTFKPASEGVGLYLQSLALQPDGKILVANSLTTPARLLANGSLDPGFHPVALPQAYTPAPSHQPRDWTVDAVALAPDGKIYVGFATNLIVTNDFPDPESQIVRVNADGTLDTSFTPLAWTGNLVRMRALADGGLAVDEHTGQLGSAGIPFPYDKFVRVTGSGAAFSGYTSPSFAGGTGSSLYIYPDGSVLYSDMTVPALYRLNSLGVKDTNFSGGIGQPTVAAVASDGHILVGGGFTAYDGVSAQHIARLNDTQSTTLHPPKILGLYPDKTTVSLGEKITVRAAVTGSPFLSYEWGVPAVSSSVSSEPAQPATATYTFSFVTPQETNDNILHLTVRNAAGTATSAGLHFTVLPDAPVITSAPAHVSAQSGRNLILHFDANPGSGNLVTMWTHNGQPVTGNSALAPGDLPLGTVTSATAGTYVVTLQNRAGATVSTSIAVTVDDSSRFVNLSTRSFVGPGQQTMIAGFAIPGRQARTVLIRGIGPTLAKFGVSGFLADPQITVYSASGTPTGYSNDNWSNGDPQEYLKTNEVFEQVGAFRLDTTSLDAALVARLDPGNYTVVLTSTNGQSGNALVEVYEYDNVADRIVNLSTRAMVAAGDSTVAGLAIRGPVAKKVLLRAVGPGLGAFGVTGTLPDPRLSVRNDSGAEIAANDNWGSTSSAPEVAAAAASSGAFALANGSKDASLVVTLQPGNYTIVVDDTNKQSGIVIVEAYEVP